VHHKLAWALLGLIALHVTGVVVTSLRHRENLVGAMVHGRKDPGQAGDIV
jgi:cytochrome b